MGEILESFCYYIEGITLVIIGLVGLLGNILMILWFLKKENIFHHLMTALAFCDSFYILCSIFVFSIPKNFARGFLSLVCVVLPLAQVSMTGSIYLTLAIAVERYTTVCHPWYKISHKWRSSLYIVPILLFSILYNIPKFLELRVVQNENITIVTREEENMTDFLIKPTGLRENHLYINVYLIYMNLIVNGLVPFIGILVLNISIYRQICQLQKGRVVSNVRFSIQNQQEIRLSQISVAITAVFILCHSVKWIPNIWELLTVLQHGKVEDWPEWVQTVSCLSHLLTTFNSSVNFFIYFIKYKQRKHNNQSLTSVDLEILTTTLV